MCGHRKCTVKNENIAMRDFLITTEISSTRFLPVKIDSAADVGHLFKQANFSSPVLFYQ